MVRNAEWIRRSVLTVILQPQESRCSKWGYCDRKVELTNHVNTAINSYAPVRCLRMDAFCIAFGENHSPLRLLILTFVCSLGEREKNTTPRLWATKGGERNERRQ